MKAAYLLLIVTLNMDDCMECMGSSIIYTQHDSFADLCFTTYLDPIRSLVSTMSVRLEECKICLKSVRMEEFRIE